MVAGWALVIAALILLPPRTPRSVFVCVALVVEIGGLALLVRSHMPLGARK